MRLPVSTRVLLILLGLGVAAVGVVGLLSEWPLGTPMIVLVFGLLMVTVAAIGSMPNLNWREGTILWPDPKLYERLDLLEKALKDLRETDTQLAVKAESDAEVLDYILSRLPAPPDGDEYDSDHARLAVWEERLGETEHEITSRYYSGEDYDDGISIQGLEMTRDDQRRDIRLESRRLKAKKRFGPARYDGHHPTREI
ncbi:hypothetical protein O7621_03685 [Solwaraspora sp. WMMD937]|uniref:hypothetical protein n=1 Tax=Solwaraspora sp. WMMD937 TaxID=3016090 RepID=UPI00249AA816|nr:hypothetical protein [Solwaraspora sp. WMMD937]WFE22461.1 hypothetical protein O7621_03685 [Solwaraspora sp. WMMD937]